MVERRKWGIKQNKKKSSIIFWADWGVSSHDWLCLGAYNTSLCFDQCGRCLAVSSEEVNECSYGGEKDWDAKTDTDADDDGVAYAVLPGLFSG